MEDTVGYMVLGYAAATIIMLALIGYLVLKARRLRGEIGSLRAIEVEQETEKKSGDMPAAHEWQSPV